CRRDWLMGCRARPRQRASCHAVMGQSRRNHRSALVRDRGSADLHRTCADAIVPALALRRLSFPGSHSVWLGLGALPKCRGKDCMRDWMTMYLEARNLAFNNVAHVGPEFARTKSEGWAAASKALRVQRPKHLDVAYARGDRTKWDLYPATDPRAP